LLLFTAGCESGLAELVTSPPWSKRFGDSGDQTVLAIAVNGDGNMGLTGTYTGTLDLGGGPLQGDFEACSFVASLDAAGHHRWSVPIIGGHVSVYGVAATADGWVMTASYSDRTVVAGTLVNAFGDDVLLAAFDDTGKPRWIKHWSADDGGPSGAGSAQPTAGVAVDARGDIVMAGEFTGTFGFGGPFVDTLNAPLDVFVTKLDAEGRERWATTYGDGNVATHAAAMAVAPGSDIVVVGARSSFEGDMTGFIARFDEHGKLRRDLVFSGLGTSQVMGVAVDPRGDAIVTGMYRGVVHLGGVALSGQGARGFVAAISPEGTVRWASTFGEDDYASSTVVAHVVADDAGAIVSGTYNGPQQSFPVRPSFGVPSGFVVAIGAAGEVGSFQALSPTPNDASSAPFAALSGNDVLLAGSFQGDLSLAGATLHSAGGKDAFVSRAPR
jgi:hypothetical protein